MDIKYTNDDRNYQFAKVEGIDGVAYAGAFGNCQNFVINDFRSVFFSNGLDLKYINNFLYKISTAWNRMYCVIDITEYTYEKLKSLVNDGKLNVTFVVESPYQNYNDSDMVLCILDLSSLNLIE